MNKHNDAGTVAISTPILNRMNKEIMRIYMGLSDGEMKCLHEEIKSVTETNCDYIIYDIAQMMKDYVNTAVNGI